MRTFYFFLLIGLFFVFSSIGFAQSDIQSKQTELNKLRKEIEQVEKKIKEKGKKEQSTLGLLDQYDRQANLLQRLIKAIQKQERQIESDIAETRNTIQSLNSQMNSMKKQYAKYITRLYKYGKSNDIELLLASKSFNQSMVRAEYLKKFSDQRKKDLDNIVVQKDDIQKENIKLQKQLAEQQDLFDQKKKEESSLADQVKKRRQLLAQIRKDKKSLQQDAGRIAGDAKKLEKFITKLIEEEKARKEREAAIAKAKKLPPPPPSKSSGVSFGSMRKSLPWPVDGGKITARFGNQQHPQLGTVTVNTGIDVSVAVGTKVQSVADGEVSLISWLPSFGNLVIIDHSEGFRTVYAHLSEISVSEGDKVFSRTPLGKSGESLEGATLHFEVWKDKDKQNPELWLKPRGFTQK